MDSTVRFVPRGRSAAVGPPAVAMQPLACRCAREGRRQLRDVQGAAGQDRRDRGQSLGGSLVRGREDSRGELRIGQVSAGASPMSNLQLRLDGRWARQFGGRGESESHGDSVGCREVRETALGCAL